MHYHTMEDGTSLVNTIEDATILLPLVLELLLLMLMQLNFISLALSVGRCSVSPSGSTWTPLLPCIYKEQKREASKG